MATQLSTASFEARPKPLSEEDFIKLNIAAEKYLTIRNTYDSNGKELDLILSDKGNMPIALLDSLQRPLNTGAIAIQLTKLSFYKSFRGGENGLKVIIVDAKKDLVGKSEWALLKACEEIRKSSDEFFNYGDFLKSVSRFDYALQRMKRKEQEENNKTAGEEENNIPTAKQKRRRLKLLHLATKQHDQWTHWENKFYELTKKRNSLA
jgi:hypothetical protein